MLKHIEDSESKKRGIGFGSSFKIQKKPLGTSQHASSSPQPAKFSQTPKSSGNKSSFSSPSKGPFLLGNHKEQYLSSPRTDSSKKTSKTVKSTFATKNIHNKPSTGEKLLGHKRAEERSNKTSKSCSKQGE